MFIYQKNIEYDRNPSRDSFIEIHICIHTLIHTDKQTCSSLWITMEDLRNQNPFMGCIYLHCFHLTGKLASTLFLLLFSFLLKILLSKLLSKVFHATYCVLKSETKFKPVCLRTAFTATEKVQWFL